MLDREAALKAGDLTAFAEADERLTAAVERLIELGRAAVPAAAHAVRTAYQISSSVTSEAGELVEPQEPAPARVVASAAVSSVTLRNGHTIARYGQRRAAPRAGPARA